MIQVLIALTSVIVIFLTQQKNNKRKKYACIFGLASQPLWFYSSYQAEQWGIFILSFFYTYAWAVGFYNDWIKQQKEAISNV